MGGSLLPFGKIVCAVAVFASCWAAPAARAGTEAERVAAVENHYRAVTDLTAHVVQKNVLKAIGRTQTFEGELAIKKPGRLRLAYTNGQLILLSDHAALFYSHKNRQLVKKSFTDFDRMNVPVAFLLGAARIRDDFAVLPGDAQEPGSLELVPKREGAAMRSLLLRTAADGRIEGMVIIDRSGNRSDVTLSGMRENTGLADSLFVFTAPKGTEIIE